MNDSNATSLPLSDKITDIFEAYSNGAYLPNDDANLEDGIPAAVADVLQALAAEQAKGPVTSEQRDLGARWIYWGDGGRAGEWEDPKMLSEPEKNHYRRKMDDLIKAMGMEVNG